MIMKMFVIVTILYFLSYMNCFDYCKLCTTHTMCKFKQSPSNRCVEYGKVELTSDLKKSIVDTHNDIRNLVALGDAEKELLPAANMKEMIWDDELAAIAQRWADQCIPFDEEQHDLCRRVERFDVGQNILTAVTGSTTMPDLIILILHWYKQVHNIDLADIENFTRVKTDNFLIGQFTQLVWATTEYVGCGLSYFKDNDNGSNYFLHRFICNYGPKGNIFGQSVYLKGKQCSKCPNKQCGPIRKGLCQNKKINTIEFYLKYMEHFSEKEANFPTDDALNHNALYFNPDFTTVFKQKAGITIENLILKTFYTNEFSNISNFCENYKFHDLKKYLDDLRLSKTINFTRKKFLHMNRKINSNILKIVVPKYRHFIRSSTEDNEKSNLDKLLNRIGENDLFIKGIGYFRRANGSWYNGLCKCNFNIRSNAFKQYYYIMHIFVSLLINIISM